MQPTFMPSMMDAVQLQEHQLRGLQWTVDHAYKGSSVYRDKLDACGVRPQDIRALDDLQHLPFTSADDLREGYPLPLLAVPESEVVRIHASSGTTGKKKVLAYTQKDIDDWLHMFARCYEMAGLTVTDRVQIAVGYGIWTAGVGFQLGCERFGAMAIPVGPGNTDMHCQFLLDLQSTVLCATASMALLMAEEINRRGLQDQIALKKLIYGSERSSLAMRKRIKELMGIDDMFDITGMTELYGPGAGLECFRHEGVHYWADYYLVEIVDPDSMKPLPAGETGEMVITTLCKEAVPLIRYRTRDLTRLIPQPCSCGSILPMHDRFLGRSDDMFIYRAVNIYPGQIDDVLSAIGDINCEYQIILDRGDDGRDHMTLRVECCEGENPEALTGMEEMIAAEIKKQIMVSCNVELVDYCSLPRTGRKSKRIFDNRLE